MQKKKKKKRLNVSTSFLLMLFKLNEFSVPHPAKALMETARLVVPC